MPYIANPVVPSHLQDALSSFHEEYGADLQLNQSLLIVNGVPSAPSISPLGRPVRESLRRSVQAICAMAGQLRPGNGSTILPVDEADITTTYAFVAAASAEDAMAIIEHVQGYVLDRGHTLSAELVP